MIEEKTATPLLRSAVVIEGGMFASALLAGWFVGYSPLSTFAHKTTGEHLIATGYGLAAGLGMFLVGIALTKIPWEPLQRFEDFTQRQIVPLFLPLSIWQLGYVSLLAGIGEEVLFRGLFQGSTTAYSANPNAWVGSLLIVSLLFGLCHFLNWTYFFLATLMGLCFGGLLIACDHLGVCIISHALYDWLMLLYMVRRYRA